MQHHWFVHIAQWVKLGFSDIGSANNNHKMKKATQERHVFANTLSQMVIGGGEMAAVDL